LIQQKHSQRAGSLIGLCTGAVFLFSLMASATSVLPFSFSKLTGTADCIVEATVIEQTVRWSNGDSGLIVTESLLQVKDCLKGKYDLGDEFTIRTFGGELDGIVSAVPGMPGFLQDKEYVVFLNEVPKEGEGNKAYASSVYTCTGLAQGQFQILEDADTQEKFISRDIHSHLQQKTSQGVRRANQPSLDEFKNRVRELLKAKEETYKNEK